MIPPRFATTILMDGDHDSSALCVSYARLLGMAGGPEESGLPPDGDFGPLHHVANVDGGVSAALDALWREGAHGGAHSSLAGDGLLLQLAAAILRLRDRRSRPARGGLAPWQLRRACDMLVSDLTADPGLDQVARSVDLSVWHFLRAFGVDTGSSPHRWLIARRMEEARRLLLETGASVSEVAAAVGYETPSAFARMFRRHRGVGPAAFRAERRT